MTRVTGLLSSLVALLLGLAMVALFAFIFAGGMFYRTSCPSKADWTFNPIPFIVSVDGDVAHGARACTTDTATGYYAGKVPVAGGLLRAFAHTFTAQP
jgi:hypothetical protein